MEDTTSREGSLEDIREPKFIKGEMALCYFQAILYDVKCMNIRQNNGAYDVKVHYMNFHANYDSYVSELNVLKRTPANLAKKDELEKYNQKFSLSRKASTHRKSGIRRKSQKLATSNANDVSSNPVVEPFQTLELPDELISWLAFDMLQNEKGLQIVVPSRFSVIATIDDFYKYQSNIILPANSNSLREFVISLEKLFSQALCFLVNESEVNELKQISKKTVHSLCQRYSSFHLLRLIGLICTGFTEICPKDDGAEVFWDHFDDLIKYIVLNRCNLFKEDDYQPLVDNTI